MVNVCEWLATLPTRSTSIDPWRSSTVDRLVLATSTRFFTCCAVRSQMSASIVSMSSGRFTSSMMLRLPWFMPACGGGASALDAGLSVFPEAVGPDLTSNGGGDAFVA